MHTLTGAGRSETVRFVAVVAAAVTAVLYFLIGLQVLRVVDAASISSSRAGPGPFAFGAMSGITFAVTAVLLLAVRSRRLWLLVAGLQVVVIVGYVAISSARTPPFELWGLLIKACQIVILAAVGYLVVRDSRRPSA